MPSMPIYALTLWFRSFECLIQTYNILVLILYSKLQKNLVSLTVLIVSNDD